jgi:hypothetical protein
VETPSPSREPERDYRREALTERINELVAELPDPRTVPSHIAIAFETQAGHEVLRALSDGRDIDLFTARIIAYSLLAHAPADYPAEALTTYLRTGEGTHEAIRAEYAPLAEDPRMIGEGRLLLDIFGTHLFREEHPRHAPEVPSILTSAIVEIPRGDRTDTIAIQVPYDSPPETLERLVAELAAHIEERGDAFIAYLRLPGVDATSEALLSDFIFSYFNRDDIDELIPNAPRILDGGGVDGWEWDGIEVGGTVHCFHRFDRMRGV